MINKITIIAGTNKVGDNEGFSKFDLERGKVYSVVGYTGSGKSQFIKDIEELSDGEGVTNRKILVDDKVVDNIYEQQDLNLIAHLGQNMKFIVDMKVKDFIKMHANCRNIEDEEVVNNVIKLANRITLEKINDYDNLTRLSGGQTRALMIADIAIICDSPIVLIDEIENAGIDKVEALSLLIKNNKIVIIVTHDPLITLMSDKRIVMKNGGVDNILSIDEKEKLELEKLRQINDYMMEIQNNIREGKRIC